MFQRNKNSYRIVAVCTNENKVGRYTFIDDYDSDWSEIASQMFYDEFGVYPTKMRKESSERL
jgi:hypothetical protein